MTNSFNCRKFIRDLMHCAIHMKMCFVLRFKSKCKQKRNDVITMNEMKIRRMRRRNATLRMNARRDNLNALQRHITRAHDAKTRDARRDATSQIENALIDVLNSFAR